MRRIVVVFHSGYGHTGAEVPDLELALLPRRQPLHNAARSQAQTQTQAGDQTDCERLCPCRCQRLAETETETETVRVREAERLRVGQRICSV